MNRFELTQITGDIKVKHSKNDQRDIEYQGGDHHVIATFDTEEEGLKALSEYVGSIDLIDRRMRVYNGEVYKLAEFTSGPIDEDGDEDESLREYCGETWAICPDEVAFNIENKDYYTKEEIDQIFIGYAEEFNFYGEEKLKNIISKFIQRKFTEFEVDGKTYYAKGVCNNDDIEDLKQEIKEGNID